MTTWMHIMSEVRRLDEKKKGGELLTDEEATALVALLLDFHGQVVEKLPAPTMPPLKPATPSTRRRAS